MKNKKWAIWSYSDKEPVMVFKNTKPKCKREIARFRMMAPGKYKIESANQ